MVRASRRRLDGLSPDSPGKRPGACQNRPVVALREEPGTADALERLAGALESLDVGVASPSKGERDRLAGIVRRYLIPRSVDPSMPLTVVVAGPTGSGKSTIINSLTGIDISPAGVLRPTTSRPLVLAGADRADGYSHLAGVRCEVVVGKAPVLDSMVLVDTPDFDSTSPEHRRMTENMIDVADVVVFVTSALRYADAVPWQVLRRSVARGAPVVHVLNRVTSDTAGALVDFRSRLAAEGLDDDLVSISEHHLTREAQHLPSLAIRALRRRLVALVEDNRFTAGETFQRVLTSTIARAERLASDLEERRSELRSWEAELTIEISRRLHGLDLSSVASVAPELGDGSAALTRRWRRSARKVQALDAEETDAVLTRFTENLQRDLRAWFVSGFWDELDPDSELTSLVPDLLPIGRQAIEGWVDYVRRIGEEMRPASPGLAQRVLIDSTLRSVAGPELRELFGSDAETALGRAERELRSRLEIVYGLIADHVTGRVRAELGDPDPDQLNMVLDAIGATFAPTRG